MVISIFCQCPVYILPLVFCHLCFVALRGLLGCFVWWSYPCRICFMFSLYKHYAFAIGSIWNSWIFTVYLIAFIRRSLCWEKRRIKKTKFELFGVQKAEQCPQNCSTLPLPSPIPHTDPTAAVQKSIKWLFCPVQCMPASFIPNMGFSVWCLSWTRH